MPKNIIGSQSYPRIEDENDPYYGFLDDKKLKPHCYKISMEELKEVIHSSITYASKKSSRTILNISNNIPENELKEIYKKEGVKLFNYFKKYCGDPASTAYTCYKRNYQAIGREQFRNQSLQKERMNSGWRYQYLAKGGAELSRRFLSISDLGTIEADFNATINLNNSPNQQLSIYVSVKNRVNTMGGQDWPKAISALEGVAKSDKNRTSPYICVFGIAMNKGCRIIKKRKGTNTPYSINTEIWLSDYFWPFFTNFSYEEIIKAVLDVLIQDTEQDSITIEIPNELLDSFGECCRKFSLLDQSGNFNDPIKLVDLFVGKLDKSRK